MSDDTNIRSHMNSQFKGGAPEGESKLEKTGGKQKSEKDIGYTIVKDATLELLGEITLSKTVNQEALKSVATALSYKLEVTSPSTILSLINALAPVDEYLQRHCVNVGLLNGLIARWLGLPKENVDRLVLIGLMHDCGKALVPPNVLNAPRKLTITEYEVMKMHPVFTYDLLHEFPESMRCATRYHHEKVSGTGYPDKLASGDIPLEARITAISDIYDAMVSQRAYKEPMSPFKILSMLTDLRGRELDSRLVDAFNRYMPHELLNKQVLLSDGNVGIVRAFDPDDIEYPMIEVNGSVFKSDKHLFCASMYTD